MPRGRPKKSSAPEPESTALEITPEEVEALPQAEETAPDPNAGLNLVAPEQVLTMLSAGHRLRAASMPPGMWATALHWRNQLLFAVPIDQEALPEGPWYLID